MKNNSDFHILRKANHMLPGIALVAITAMNLLSIELLKKVLFALYLTISFIEIYRLSNDNVNKWICKHFNFLLRDNEVKQPTTTTFYLLSLNLLYYYFPIEVVYVGVLVLSIGDPLASIVGIYYKDRTKNIKFKNNKSLYGSLALAIVGFVVNIIIFYLYSYDLYQTLSMSVIVGLLLFLSEIFIWNIDDNLYIPMIPAVIYLILF